MRLTSHNLTRHESLFAEIGPNRGVLVRLRLNPMKGDEQEVLAERCKLLVWGDAKEGWTPEQKYGLNSYSSVEELLAHSPELSRHHYVPSEWVYWW